MNATDYRYFSLVKEILNEGIKKADRTGTGTISSFCKEMRIDLKRGFPILTTKKMSLQSISSELAWFVKGYTNIDFLLKYNNHIWDEWPFMRYVNSKEYNGPDMTNFGLRSQKDPEFREIYLKEKKKFCERILNDRTFRNQFGDIGPGAYGAQWRSFDGPDNQSADQLKDIINQIKSNPDSRRLLVVAWNPIQVKSKDTVLPPCHFAFQFYVVNGRLSCRFMMRSTDVFLGLPYNIASYALLTHLVARECGLEVDELIYHGGDVHIYSNHLDQIKEQLTRTPKEMARLVIDVNMGSIFDFVPESVSLEGYDPYPAIKAPVAV
ncbi:thymidylate synthase [Bacillus mexicanus]|uniref:thymidylate synthase n=1 Tax=Bacillus mexicanus TaxID=2834415 RepID=UPI003D21E214